MRILLTTDTIGGVWTFTQVLSTGLLQRGHHVALLALGREPSPAQLAWSTQLAADHPAFQALFSSAPLEWMEANQHALAEGSAALESLSATFSPDLLHSNQFCFGVLSTPYPRLITAHSDVLSWGHACQPAGLAPSPWLQTCVQLSSAGLGHAHAVAAPTHWMLQALARQYPQLPSQQSVIPNGRSIPQASAMPGRKLQAVSVGRLWDEGKNIGLLAQVRSPWPLLVAGDHAFGTAPAANPMPGVIMLGMLGETELLQLFRQSSVYVCTSVYEPFGLAPLEAALCGCAILLHDIPSLHEVWGAAALYFRDAQQLSAELHHLAASPEHLAAARHSAHRRALELNADRMVESYLTLYKSLLHHSNNTTGEPAQDAA